MESLVTPLDRWLHLLKFSRKYANIESEIPAELKAEEGIEMAINAYRKSLADRKVQNMIHLREKAELMTATKITLAREEGRAEGEARGEAKGVMKGKAEGKAEGRFEERVTILRRMKKTGMSIAEIAQITGLSEDEIKHMI